MDRKARFWLGGPPLFALACDAAMTLAGQSSAYWRGDYRTALELNPIAYPLLAHHPATFAAYIFAWGVVLFLGILWLPTRLAPVLSFAACFGHALAAAAWLWRAGPFGALAGVCVLVVASRWFAIAWERSGVEKGAV
jgi:hypothetical protein